MQVRDIHTSHLITSVKAVYSVVQHTVLPRSRNKNVMSGVDYMVMFCLITRRRINLMRLILDFMALTVNAKRRRYAIVLYSMFLTRVFRRAQLSIDGHKADNKCPTITMKSFFALGLKPQDQE